MKTKTLLAAMLAIGTLYFCACNDDDDDTPSTSDQTEQNSNKNNNSSNQNNNNSTAQNSTETDNTISNSDDAQYFALDKTFTSTATFYGGGYTGGCCMLDDFCSNYYVAAMNEYDYKNGLMAGAYLEVTGPNGTIDVLISDLMPYSGNESNCTVGALDLNEKAFEKIANKVDGKVKISWKVKALPTDQPVKFKFKDGSSQYWCGIQVQNHRYPLKKLEVKQNGNYVELPKEYYNYFIAQNGLGEGPYDIRLTDIYGHVIEETSIPLNQTTTGKHNF